MITLDKTPTENIQSIYDASKKEFPSSAVVAKLVTCQAILESRLSSSPSYLAVKANNLFGLKFVPLIDKDYITLPTKEFTNTKIVARFAKYDSPEDCLTRLHKLYNRPRYSDVFTAETVEDAAQMLVKGGYATDPSYAKKLVSIYKSYFQNGDIK